MRAEGSNPFRPFSFCLNSIHNPVPLHQFDAFLGQLDGAGGAAVCAGLFFARVVCNALHPRDRQQVRALFEVRVAMLQIFTFREDRPQDAALLPRPAGLDGVQRDGGGMEAR